MTKVIKFGVSTIEIQTCWILKEGAPTTGPVSVV